MNGPGTSDRRAEDPGVHRYAVALGIWLLGCASALVWYGLPDVIDWTSIFDLVLAPLALVVLTLWATLPFVLVSIAVLERTGGAYTIGVATLAALIAQAVVPRAIERSIEDDPSSTAALVHIYDPVLMSLPVGGVLGVGWLLTGRQKQA